MKWPCFQVHSRTTHPWKFLIGLLPMFLVNISQIWGGYHFVFSVHDSYWVTQVCGNDTIFITLGDGWKRKKRITISSCRFLSLFYFFLCGPLIIFSETMAAFFGSYSSSRVKVTTLHLLTKHIHTHVIAQLRTKMRTITGCQSHRNSSSCHRSTIAIQSRYRS